MRSSQLCLLLAITACVSSLQVEYGVTIDAGSSGSRIYIYQWDATDRPTLFHFPELATSPLNSTQSTLKTAVGTGIGSFGNDTEAIINTLDPLIEYARKHIPAEKIPTTLLYLKATAGMRLLSPATQDYIMNAIRGYLSQTGFHFHPHWAQVITGAEEGAFGWVAVNYLGNLLGQPANETVGALDLGGASVQMVYVPDNYTDGPDMSLVQFNEKVKYDLYSRSWLGLGVDQAQLNILKMLANDSKTVNPCWPLDYTETVSKVNNITFTGSSDFQGCRDICSRFIREFSDSPVPVVFPPRQKDFKFIGFSSFYYTFAFYNLTSGDATIRDLLEEANVTCSNDLSYAIQKASIKPSRADFAQKYCFYGVYAHTLLVEGFKFDENSVQMIPQSEMNKVEIGWAPGSMVYEATEYYYTNHNDSAGTAPFQVRAGKSKFHYNETDGVQSSDYYSRVFAGAFNSSTASLVEAVPAKNCTEISPVCHFARLVLNITGDSTNIRRDVANLQRDENDLNEKAKTEGLPLFHIDAIWTTAQFLPAAPVVDSSDETIYVRISRDLTATGEEVNVTSYLPLFQEISRTKNITVVSAQSDLLQLEVMDDVISATLAVERIFSEFYLQRGGSTRMNMTAKKFGLPRLVVDRVWRTSEEEPVPKTVTFRFSGEISPKNISVLIAGTVFTSPDSVSVVISDTVDTKRATTSLATVNFLQSPLMLPAAAASSLENAIQVQQRGLYDAFDRSAKTNGIPSLQVVRDALPTTSSSSSSSSSTVTTTSSAPTSEVPTTSTSTETSSTTSTSETTSSSTSSDAIPTSSSSSETESSTTEEPKPTSEEEPKKKMTAGDIALTVIGSIAGVLLIVAGVILFLRWRKRRAIWGSYHALDSNAFHHEF
ncbi:hypothetical protein PROFUN_04030 [Planoprotostelium fungivorum]|uniref:Apyrase n=1 Tax=Planoprotostelium fungivorum TaxID=1890364 RepID=A0A2P6NW60_9EUKA|nr:hypothetical protein PROFUN_04030 [Planoprotostelium fungivorum]